MKHDVQGIYQIKNLKNDKVYIGSSKAVYKRWHDHKRDLKNNKHANSYLQASWIKYGEECFKFSILEKVEDLTLLLIREAELIIQHKTTCPEFGYNIDIPNANERRIELYKLLRNENKKEKQVFVQVDVQTGIILKKFTSRLEAAALLNISKDKVDDMLELNIFKARSHQSRILHPIDNYILMYEKFYQPNYDYKSAIKTGEIIKIVRGDYQDTLTKYEFDNLVGKKVNDYTWVRLRKISYEEGSVSHLGYTLTFLRKPLVDNPKEPEMKVAEFKERPSEGKFSSKGTIIGLREGKEVYKFNSPTDMATQLSFPYKQACRLLGKDSSKKSGKRTWKGVTFYYEKDLR